MKKTIVLGLTLIMLVILLPGCGAKKEAAVSYHLDVENASTSIYGDTEDSTVFHIGQDEISKFEIKEEKQDNITPTRNFTVLGQVYEGTYVTTVVDPTLGVEFHRYDLPETENGSVMVDAKTDEILEYHSIPFDSSQLVNEEDYLAIVQQMLNERIDLNKYEYDCNTHYYEIGADYIQSQSVPGFREITAENEELGGYQFYYTHSVNGVQLPGHVSAIFYDGKVILEMYDFDYDDNTFAAVLKKLNEVEDKADLHLRQNIKDGCTLQDIQHKNKRIFVHEGSVYVEMTSTVTYQHQSSDAERLSVLVTTITG